MPAIAKPSAAPANPSFSFSSQAFLPDTPEALAAISAQAADYPAGVISAPQRHDRGLLLCALRGVVTVLTDTGNWVVAPGQALWLPAGVLHQKRGWDSVAIRALFIDPMLDGLPRACQAIQVSPLLQVLIVEAIALQRQGASGARAGHIHALILDEMRHICPASLHVPLPAEPRLRRICQALLRDPASRDGLDAWAAYGGLSRRSLTRMFRAHTGASFNEWRQRVLLMEALTLLSHGAPIAEVAQQLGYASPGAFATMFRRTLGVSPRDYFRWPEAPAGGPAASRAGQDATPVEDAVIL
ncbi:AraC family transcriptional regulator [Bordetella genomosp. 5]|uniref:AraC family transcriptional regulator n=1 Tax=Bordetella genomosp. 5 TaxID=1395608 RepID=A0A261T3R7_9BORD|nr:helix-turn-helix transcriptional regulator [Bordetella genomosp. 5]OZI43862.1 AraC family transcriptional regulator [Bordetella genomosp. 5]